MGKFLAFQIKLFGFFIIVIFVNLAHADLLGDVIEQENTLRSLEKERQHALTQSLERTPNQLKPKEVMSFLPPVLGETPCFNIDRIQLKTQGTSEFQWLIKDLGAFTHVCLGIQSLQALQTNLNNRLLAAGYVTSRVSLPDQQLNNGELLIQLHEGYVATVRLEDAAPLDWFTLPWATWRNAVPISRGDTLNIRDLDQGVEQLQRLPSQEVLLLVEPADAENMSTVVIKRQQYRRVRGYLGADNAGSASIGRNQGQLGMTMDAPLGINDQLSLNTSSNLENATPNHRNQSASVYYSIPYGYHTFSASFGYLTEVTIRLFGVMFTVSCSIQP
jgi:hemolysin activation/secretion protein